MEAIKNILFTRKNLSTINKDKSIDSIDREFLLHSDNYFINIDTLSMAVYDSAYDDLLATFNVNAMLIKQTHRDKLQNLKLKTNTVNTYNLNLDFIKDDEIYSLSGRNTSENRNKARKILLSGLSGSNYTGTIEEARQTVIHSFSTYITTTVFDTNEKLIQGNVPRVNTWLISLLG